ncbi:TetR/AcrR family transcriptional regulator [Haloactinomyces albus]|uniref:AcrR family transcriptional regulator n=1 Tax=Haloactinomyces albus TaxID=1352928 RepID=A0AAE4CKH2_9ACTN|nr:TetR/AcrR family transcriptional regulator [Haloactinomyces albus]MDR7300341.1 AcrR family transcriptional regulator [Haloactinomyces albus]
MPGRTAAERGREVRQKLLAAAAELIPELGWNAVTTRVLAERAGVAAGLVHYHFPSLQALLGESAVGVMRRVMSTAGPALDSAETVEAGMDMILGILDGYTGNDSTSLVFIEAYLAATRDENLRGELTALVADFRRDLARWLGERGRDRPEETASVLAAAIDGVLLHRALNPELTSAAVAPVLCKLFTPAESDGSDGSRKAGSR